MRAAPLAPGLAKIIRLPVHHRPIFVEVCYICHGAGWVDDGQLQGLGRGHVCCTCGGRGRIATEGGEG